MFLGILIGINLRFFAFRTQENVECKPLNLSDEEINKLDDNEFINYISDYLNESENCLSRPLRQRTAVRLGEAVLIISLIALAYI